VTQQAAIRPSRALALLLALLGAALIGSVAVPAPAQAADGYRYWMYWDAKADPPWIYATVMADANIPPDGTVDGWRFGVAGESPESARTPRMQPEFEAICAGTPAAPAGQKRIALVVDYGVAADAVGGATPPEPRVACVTVPEQATSGQVLAASAQLRVEDGLVCAIDGYPATGCGDAVPDFTPPTAPEPTLAIPAAASASPAAEASTTAGTSVPWAPIIAVVVIAALAVVGVVLGRRNRG